MHEKNENTQSNYYDIAAEEMAWFGPEISFGLMTKFTKAGDQILDIGIGTGLCAELCVRVGLKVIGMDNDAEMLNICRKKAVTTDLIQHDLTDIPYPFEKASLDHVLCVGVLNFFGDLSRIFAEVSRILAPAGTFTFVVAHREPNEAHEIVTHEHNHEGHPITMFRHGDATLAEYFEVNGFEKLRDLKFPIYMDLDKKQMFLAKALVTRKTS